MYLLDTNVVSELRRRDRADANVLAWITGIATAELYLSVVSVTELETGALLIGRRDPDQGRLLLDWITAQVLPTFAGRIIPVDLAIARRCAALHVPNPRPVRDTMIAATALVHGMTVVTRNARDFQLIGVPYLDPWQPTA